jgi:hypothetical protein
MLKSINDISGIIKQSLKYENDNNYYDEVKSIFGSNSDITSIYKITSLLKCKFPDLLIYKINNNNNVNLNVLERFRTKYNDILKEYRRKNYTAIKDSIDLMNWLHYNGYLDSDKGFLHWIKSSGTFKKLLLDDINKAPIKKVCDDYYLNYVKIVEYYEKLVDLIISILSADIEYDKDYKKVNPFIEAKKLNSYLLKEINKDIEEQLNYAFFISQPLFFSVMFENGYKTMSTYDCSIKKLYVNYKVYLNTLCNNIGSYIGYYNIKNNQMSIIYNIDINKLCYYNPYHYNPNNIVNILVQNNNKITYMQFNSNEWNKLIMIITNTYSNLAFDRFPLNNPNFKIIEDYTKQYKNKSKNINMIN